MADVSRFPEGALLGPFVIATARPIGTIAIISDGANPGEPHRSTSFPAAGWTVIGGGGGSDLATTLVAGNTTGGTDIEVTSGDAVVSAAGAPIVLQPATNQPIQAAKLGNTRGADAVDLQLVRANVADVAASPRSGLFAGQNNEISPTLAPDAVVLGGRGNRIVPTGGSYESYGAAVVGGSDNYIGNDAYCAFLTGRGNRIDTSSGYYASGAFAAGTYNFFYTNTAGVYNSGALGFNNRVDSGQDSFAVGIGNRVYANYSWSGGNGSDVFSQQSFCWGGNVQLLANAFASAGFGFNTLAAVQGQMTWGAGARSLNSAVVPAPRLGAAQPSGYVLATTTAGTATPQIMSTDGSTSLAATNRLNIRENIVYRFRIEASAYQTGGAAGTTGDVATWTITGAIKRVGATTSLVGAVTGDGTPSGPADAGAAAWDITVAADNTNDALQLTVTGETNKNIVWAARVDTVEAGNPQ